MESFGEKDGGEEETKKEGKKKEKKSDSALFLPWMSFPIVVYSFRAF